MRGRSGKIEKGKEKLKCILLRQVIIAHNLKEATLMIQDRERERERAQNRAELNIARQDEIEIKIQTIDHECKLF